MSDADKLIEAVARAIYHADAQEISWETLCDLTEREGYIVAKVKHSVCMTHARAALSAIEASGTHVVANVEKWPTPEALASALETTDYKYFGDYTLSEGQWDAVTTLCVAARELLSARPRITGGTE